MKSPWSPVHFLAVVDFFSLKIPSPVPRHEGNPVVQEGPLAKAHLETSLAGVPQPDGQHSWAWLAAVCLPPPWPHLPQDAASRPVACPQPAAPSLVCVRPRGRSPLPLRNFLDLTGPAEPRAVAAMVPGVHSVGIRVPVGPDCGVPL